MTRPGKRRHLLAAGWLSGVAATILGGPAYGADAASDAAIRALQAQVLALTQMVQELKQAQDATRNASAPAETPAAATKIQAAKAADTAQQEIAARIGGLKSGASTQYGEVESQRASDVKVSFNNARPAFTSADGLFSLSLRALVQFDSAYYSQPHLSGASPPTDLSSGTNFRRARLGFEGKAFGDWSYSFLYDLGGTSGTEGARISDAYIQFDGLAPLHFRTGAYATPENLEDQTGTGDLIFIERAAPADLARGIAGSDGRENFFGVIANDTDYYASLSWSGAKTGDSVFFDEQQALVGRAAYRVYKDADANVVLSAGGTYVFKVADISASPIGISPVTFSVVPENYVDAQKLIGTPSPTSATVLGSAINGRSIAVWNIEAAANWKNFYGQGGYFGYSVARTASPLPNPGFSGWYAQASWVITGEPRRYSAATATWTSPQPANPLGLNGAGWGVWELAGRYSVIDLDFNAGTPGLAPPSGGIRGGKQEGWTAGLNWYPNPNVRLLFNYQRENIDRLAGASPYQQIGQTVNIFSTRAQLAF